MHSFTRIDCCSKDFQPVSLPLITKASPIKSWRGCFLFPTGNLWGYPFLMIPTHGLDSPTPHSKPHPCAITTSEKACTWCHPPANKLLFRCHGSLSLCLPPSVCTNTTSRFSRRTIKTSSSSGGVIKRIHLTRLQIGEYGICGNSIVPRWGILGAAPPLGSVKVRISGCRVRRVWVSVC